MRIRRRERKEAKRDPKLAAVEDKLSDALEAIADDMDAGTNVDAERDVAVDIINTLEDAGYDVVIEEDLKEAVGLEDEKPAPRASRRPGRRASRRPGRRASRRDRGSDLHSLRREIRNLTR